MPLLARMSGLTSKALMKRLKKQDHRICGSGIIEVLGEMYLSGIISEDGVIDGTLSEKTDRIFEDGRTFNYVLVILSTFLK